MNSYFDKVDFLRLRDCPGDEYYNMLNKMSEEVEYFSDTFRDDYRNMSEWGHQYFCEIDGGKLRFNLDTPHSHICEICGREYTGSLYDNIWIYFYRNEAALTIWKAAALYKVRKEKRYLGILKKILSYYAENYTKFILHVKGKVNVDINHDVGGAGRLMPQGLNEAIMTIRILNALEMVKEDLNKEFLTMVKEKFLDEVVNLLKPQVTLIHNIPCWKNSVIGIIGFFTGNEELVDFAFNGEFGIVNQLSKGVSEDGFWYEGSIHYNFFVLEGVTNLLLFAKLYNHDANPVRNKVEQMLTAAYHYAFDNGILPNPNDGWPNISLKTYSYIYEIAAKVFGEASSIGNLLKNIENKEIKRTYLPLSKPYFYKDICLEGLILNPDIDLNNFNKIETKSANFKTSYYGIVRRGNINVFLKYGHKGPSHAHPDKMTVEIMVGNKSLSRDLSNSGYGVKLCNEWHRMTVAHNTIAVDCKNQSSFEGGDVLIFDESTLKTVARDVYEGVDYSRQISITENSIKDIFSVGSEEEHTYDYFFHSEAKLLTHLETEKYCFNCDANGYQHIKNPRKVIIDKENITLSWSLGEYSLKSNIDLKGKELIIAETYDNPVTSYRTTLILRSKGKSSSYKVLWDID